MRNLLEECIGVLHSESRTIKDRILNVTDDTIATYMEGQATGLLHAAIIIEELAHADGL